MMTPADQQALAIIGINIPMEMQTIQAAPNPTDARQRLSNLKDKARKAYRKAAIVFHPDTNGDDAGKTRVFVALTKAVEALCAIELRVIPPPRAPIHVTVTYYPTASTTTTSTTTTSTYTAWRVVNMRPF
jgi:hypothetical protein